MINIIIILSYQGGSVQQLKSRGVALGCVRTLVVVAEERPRIALCNRCHSSIPCLVLDQNLNLVSFSASQRCSPRSASHRAQCRPRSAAGRTSRSACKELPLRTPPPSMLISGRSGALLLTCLQDPKTVETQARPSNVGGTRQPALSAPDGVRQTAAWRLGDHRRPRVQGPVRGQQPGRDLGGVSSQRQRLLHHLWRGWDLWRPLCGQVDHHFLQLFHLMLILDVKARHWEQHSANICPDRISWLPQKD